MSEEVKYEMPIGENKEDPIVKTWPPTEDQIKDIAVAALNQSQDKDVTVLVFWDNPTLMILEPLYFGDTTYIEKKYTNNERSVLVIIGKAD